MRAKTVNESLGNSMSYEEAVELVKKATETIGERQRFIGPSLRERPDGSKFVDYYGGKSQYYDKDQIDELLEAMQIVEDTMTNVSWTIDIPQNEWDSFRIGFNSDGKRKSDSSFEYTYKKQPGHWRGD
jgi:transposase